MFISCTWGVWSKLLDINIPEEIEEKDWFLIRNNI
jgi:hypothetical protein